MKVSKNIRRNGTPVFSYENDALWSNYIRESFYEKADRLERTRVFELDGMKPQEQLEHLKDEILIRGNISKREAFIKGEMLCIIKKICQEQKMKFKSWIEQNCDFSYETANNLMNVFKQCFSRMDIALQIPISVLYKISAPSFPDDLRQYLLDNGNLTDITNGEIKNLVKKYKTEGLEAVTQDIEELSTGYLIQRQTNRTFDKFENALRTLEALKNNLNDPRRKEGLAMATIDCQTKEAKEINLKLFDALNEAHETMERARNEAGQIIKKYMGQLEAKHLSPEWKEDHSEEEIKQM